MFKLKSLAMIAIVALSCLLAPVVEEYAWRKADRLEQLGTGADPDRPVFVPPVATNPTPDVGRTDFRRPRVKADDSTSRPGEAPTLLQTDPMRQEMLSQAVMYRNVSVACRKYRWQAPLATIAFCLMMLAMSRMNRARMESFMSRMAAQRASEEAQQEKQEAPNAQ